MAKKKTEKKEKNVTLNDLAIMVNKGFQSVQDEMDKRFDEVDKRFDEVDKRFEKVDEGFDNLEHGMREGFSKVNGSIERVDRRVDHHEDEILKTKSRVKIIERELKIPSPR